MELVLIGIGIILISGAVMFLMYHNESDNKDMSERGTGLANKKYDTNMTRFKARKEAKASAVRGELLTNIETEVNKIADIIVAETRTSMEGYRQKDSFSAYSMEKEQLSADHALQLSMKHNQIKANEIAGRLGVSPKAFEELVLEKAKMETALAMKKNEMLLEVEKTKLLKDIELQFEKSLAELDVKMTMIANSLPQHRLDLLHNQLAGIHKEYEQAKLLEDGEYKEKEIKRLEKKMETWEGAIYEKE